ncbi:MAG: transglutaminase domain-containing protein [Planctomycetia bacterium]|nr:transglutaminase domain-containing protein [Planctomycetia bacterium]
MIVTAGGEPCAGIVATVPVPMDWPEQEVRIVSEDFSPYVKHAAYREQTGVKQLVVNIPQIPAGEQVRAVITVETTRSTLLPPEDTSGFVIPKKLDRKVRPYLAASPKIESRNPKIRNLAKEITADHEGAWEKAEAIYDWVREHVKYQDGPLKGALAALNDGTGDCEELTSLFIALCRASGIPARTVWVPGHCYPEFYLEDDMGHGHWFACQAAGDRSFGGIAEVRPILQKGDNFTVPEKPREKLRYVAEFLTGAGGQPKVKWVRVPVRGPA